MIVCLKLKTHKDLAHSHYQENINTSTFANTALIFSQELYGHLLF